MLLLVVRTSLDGDALGKDETSDDEPAIQTAVSLGSSLGCHVVSRHGMEGHERRGVDEEKNLNRQWKLLMRDDGAGPALSIRRVAVAVSNKGK